MSTGERHSVAYVLPVHDEAQSLSAFHEALIAATSKRRDLDFEFVYVDDGSRAPSLGRPLPLRPLDDGVPALSMSRNFGPQTAVPAGLAAVPTASAVVVMDTDLQDPP